MNQTWRDVRGFIGLTLLMFSVFVAGEVYRQPEQALHEWQQVQDYIEESTPEPIAMLWRIGRFLLQTALGLPSHHNH